MYGHGQVQFTSPFACWNHRNILPDQLWSLWHLCPLSVAQNILVSFGGMVCLTHVMNSFWLLNATPVAQQVKQGNFLFLSDSGCHEVFSMCQQTWKSSPSNYFEYHHYPPCFSSIPWSLHCRSGSVSADFSTVAVSSAASVGVCLTALIFSNRVSWHFSPAVANSKPSDDALIMLSLHWVSTHSVHNQPQSHS